MSASARNASPRIKRLCSSLALTLIASSVLAHAQRHAGSHENVFLWGQRFLTSMFPELSKKHHFMTIQTSTLYDDPADPINHFQLYVGDGPKDLLRGYSAGCMGDVEPPQFSYPSDLGNPGNATVPGPERSSRPGTQSPKKDCATGPVFAKQFLTAAFAFDDSGRISIFNATGPAVGEPDAYNRVTELAYEHPELSTAQIVAALKQAGAKYGPTDESEFVKSLPLSVLEPFLGKINVVSVKFTGLDRPSILPMWDVKAVVPTAGASKLTYELWFEPFKGDLLLIKRPSAVPGRSN